MLSFPDIAGREPTAMAKGKFSALTLPPQGPMHACPPQGPSSRQPRGPWSCLPKPSPTPHPACSALWPQPQATFEHPPQRTRQGWGTSTPMGTMESAPGPHPDGQSHSALPTTSCQPAPQGGGSPASCWGIRLTLPLRPQRLAGPVPLVSPCSCGCLCALCCCWRWPCTVASRTSGPSSTSWSCTYGKQPSPAGTASYSFDGRAGAGTTPPALRAAWRVGLQGEAQGGSECPGLEQHRVNLSAKGGAGRAAGKGGPRT